MTSLVAPPAAETAATRTLAVAISVAVLAGYALLSLALGQDANWDLRNYHWYNGYAFLTGRHGFDMAPAQVPSFYNPLLDVPLFLLADALPARAAMTVWSLLQGLNFVLLFALAHALTTAGSPMLRLWASAGTALIGILGAGTLSQLGTTFHDNVVSLGVIGGLLVAVRWRDTLFGGHTGQACAVAAAAGLLVGAAAGLKQPSVIFCVGLCFGFLLAPGGIVRRFTLSFTCGLGVLAGIALTGGYWMWFLWETYGNPLHPYFNTLFGSPLAAPSDYRDTQFVELSPTLLDRLLLGFRLLADPNLVGEIPLPGEAPWRDPRIAVLTVLIPAAALSGFIGGRGTRLTHAAAGRYVLAAVTLSCVTWAVMFCIYRYLVPVEMLAPIAILLAADRLPLATLARAGVAAAVMAGVQLATVTGDWGRIAWTDRLVEVDLPRIPAPGRTMVLMAGYQPMSFIIPEFPPEIPFLRIQSNFVHPDPSPNGYNDALRGRIDAHRGDVFVVSTIPDTDLAADAVRFHGRRLAWQECQVIRSNLNEPLNFCRTYPHDGERTPAGSATEP
ncbi:hypothetical protein [Arenibaculum sp.]|uniref:hypothetical protein n=1 Tax=Arenibaculum sp. TaxID=2865862 RepID=UPI002E1190B6|nr:hypothetical protein [Arenibaculum sp.]